MRRWPWLHPRCFPRDSFGTQRHPVTWRRFWFDDQVDGCAGCFSASSSFESDRNGITHILTNGFPDIGSYRQLVGAISQSHERTLERMAIHCALYLDQPTGPKKLHRLRPDHVGPPGLVWTLLQFCRKGRLHDSMILPRCRDIPITLKISAGNLCPIGGASMRLSVQAATPKQGLRPNPNGSLQCRPGRPSPRGAG